MAKHEMRLSATELPVKKGGITLAFVTDKAKFGQLEVTNATLTWYPKNAVKGYVVSVEDFAEWAKTGKKQK